jgi:hypothetical protein
VFRVRTSPLAGSDTLIEHGRTAGRLFWPSASSGRTNCLDKPTKLRTRT